MIKLIPYVLFLLAINAHAMFRDSDLAKLFGKINITCFKGSSCNRLAKGIFLGSYHGAYPEGFSFLGKHLSKDEIAGQAFVHQTPAPMIGYFYEKYKACLFVYNNDSRKHYVIEYCDSSYHAIEVEIIININAKEGADTSDPLRDGAILIVGKSDKRVFPNHLRFWQPSFVLGKISNIIIKSIFPFFNDSNLQGFDELKLALKEVFAIVNSNNGYLILNNIDVSGGMSGSIVCDGTGTIMGVVVASGKIEQDCSIDSEWVDFMKQASQEFAFRFAPTDVEGSYILSFDNALFVKLISQEEFESCQSSLIK